MRKRTLLALLLLFACLCTNIFANESNRSGTQNPQKTGVVICQRTNGQSTSTRRIPPNTDVLLIIKDECVTVCFFDDFGRGSYHLTDLSTALTVIGTVEAATRSETTIPLKISDSSSLVFNIEFEDGSWCHLTWND